MSDGSIRAVEEIVMYDQQISVQHVADELAVSKSSLYEIMSDYLGMKRLCTRRVPKLFTPLRSNNAARKRSYTIKTRQLNVVIWAVIGPKVYTIQQYYDMFAT